MKVRLVLAGFILFLALTLSFKVLVSFASRFECDVRVFPDNPTEHDDVRVFVNFNFRSQPPFVDNFSDVQREDTTFSVVAVVQVPAENEYALQIIHNESCTYQLGKLEAGDYIFRVYVQTVHGSSEYWLEKEVRFSVSGVGDEEGVHTPELSNIGYLLVLLALTLVATVLLKASKRKK